MNQNLKCDYSTHEDVEKFREKYTTERSTIGMEYNGTLESDYTRNSTHCFGLPDHASARQN